jgi:preprotein translocase subunit SecB
MERGYDSHSLGKGISALPKRIQTKTRPPLAGVSGESFMTNGNGTPPEQAPPQLNVLAQYTKDLSFENPNAPGSLAPQQQQPAINIQINVGANNLSESEFEVTLSVEGKAENAGKVMFSFDLAYAGVFRIMNVPKENLHPLIMIECPRLLFPFAREIIATAVRDGGFPPLMLDPVDFVGLYRQNMERQAAAQAATGAKPS